jgi:hypothetical protein
MEGEYFMITINITLILFTVAIYKTYSLTSKIDKIDNILDVHIHKKYKKKYELTDKDCQPVWIANGY